MSKMQPHPDSLTYENELLCEYQKTCILPCSFKAGDDTFIHWSEKTNNAPVYIYHDGKHQHQHPNYTDRSFLFDDMIPRGNASLLIENVRVQDEGLYHCWARTSEGLTESDILMKVEAPVVSVRLEKEGGSLVCTSEGIHPKPNMTWTIDSEPATDPQPSIVQSDAKLYSVNSSVPLHYSQSYSCNVSTEYSRRYATYREATIPLSDSLTLQCSKNTLESPVNSVNWMYNHKESICNWTGSELVCSEHWKPFVKQGTEPTTLELKGLTQKQQGVYTCKSKTDSGTHTVAASIISVAVMTTALQVVVFLVGLAIVGLLGTTIILVQKHLKDRAAKKNIYGQVEMDTNSSLETEDWEEQTPNHRESPDETIIQIELENEDLPETTPGLCNYIFPLARFCRNH